jgi:limonene-1,2-epoxide hydrolase
MASNLETIRSFVALWATRDLDAILAAMTEDCFYHNMPWPPQTGHAEIRASLAPFISSADAIDWVLHHIAESADGMVLTERTDRFLIGGTWLEMPVMGTFELRDGRIAKWRDYFDPTPINAMMAAG